jgi:methyl-accepting chemotaxis protein
MDQVTQQNAAMVEQSTAASHSLLHEANELVNLLGAFAISESETAHQRPEARRPQAPARPATQPRPERVVRAAGGGRHAVAAEESWEEF